MIYIVNLAIEHKTLNINLLFLLHYNEYGYRLFSATCAQGDTLKRPRLILQSPTDI